MTSPDAAVLDWASVVLNTEVTVLRGLRNGVSPWLLRARVTQVILCVAPAERAAETATAAMTCVTRATGSALPVAELLGYDLAEQTGYGLVLTTRVPGTSVIPPEPDPERRAQPASGGRLGPLVPGFSRATNR